MRRGVVFSLALTFILFFAALSVDAIVEQGVNAAAIISLVVLAILGFGVVGAFLRGPDP